MAGDDFKADHRNSERESKDTASGTQVDAGSEGEKMMNAAPRPVYSDRR